jgi:hypothetical protein
MGQTGRQSLIESQRARREGDIQVSRIQAEDEARKLDLAKALPGQQLSLAQAQLAEQQAAAQIGLGKAAEARQASQFAQAAKAQNMATQVAALQESAQRAGQFGASQLLAKKQQSQADKARGGLFGQIGSLIS